MSLWHLSFKIIHRRHGRFPLSITRCRFMFMIISDFLMQNLVGSDICIAATRSPSFRQPIRMFTKNDLHNDLWAQLRSIHTLPLEAYDVSIRAAEFHTDQIDFLRLPKVSLPVTQLPNVLYGFVRRSIDCRLQHCHILPCLFELYIVKQFVTGDEKSSAPLCKRV